MNFILKKCLNYCNLCKDNLNFNNKNINKEINNNSKLIINDIDNIYLKNNCERCYICYSYYNLIKNSDKKNI